MNRLYVYFGDRHIGQIDLTPTFQMEFTYDSAWLSDARAFPVSLSMPLSDDPIPVETSHNFFANLLPEAGVRQRICAALKISPGNDYELLKAIGGDCAGALTITPDAQPAGQDNDYVEIDDQQLANWSIGTPDAFSTISGRQNVRLSLAGAQDKLPVLLRQNQFFLPRRNSPSSHLLKFSSPYYAHLPENETFLTGLAQAVELPAVHIHLQSTERARIAVVERYDRQIVGDTYRRLHQEDMCQVLGISPAQKYEKEGGPSLRQCAHIIRQHCSLPAIEVDKLLNWAIFNLLTGNADAHGKNLSVLYLPDGSINLTPFYDLVSTRNYETLDRHLAMAVGGETDPGQIGRAHFEQLARDIGVSRSLVFDTLQQLSDALLRELPNTAQRFAECYGDSPITERLPLIIRKQINRTRQLA